MHSYHRKTINTVEEWLLSIEEEDDDNLAGTNLDLDILGIYPVQGTALLYTDESICQEEK